MNNYTLIETKYRDDEKCQLKFYKYSYVIDEKIITTLHDWNTLLNGWKRSRMIPEILVWSRKLRLAEVGVRQKVGNARLLVRLRLTSMFWSILERRWRNTGKDLRARKGHTNNLEFAVCTAGQIQNKRNKCFFLNRFLSNKIQYRVMLHWIFGCISNFGYIWQIFVTLRAGWVQ